MDLVDHQKQDSRRFVPAVTSCIWNTGTVIVPVPPTQPLAGEAYWHTAIEPAGGSTVTAETGYITWLYRKYLQHVHRM